MLIERRKDSHGRMFLGQLDRIIERLIDHLAGKAGAKRVAIVGGSAMAIIATALRGDDLFMRDLDIAIQGGIKVEQENLYHIASELNLGPVSDYRPRPRGPINAGYGLYVSNKQIGIIDLIFFQKESGLKLNGIFSVDSLRIKVDPVLYPKQTYVSSLLHDIRNRGIDALLGEGVIRDRFHGIDDLLSRKIRYTRRFRKADGTLLENPFTITMRAVKLAAKWNLDRFELPVNFKKIRPFERRRLLAKARLGLNRELIKIMALENPEKMIRFMDQSGIFACIFSDLNRTLVEQNNLEGLIEHLTVSARQGLQGNDKAMAGLSFIVERMERRELTSFRKEFSAIVDLAKIHSASTKLGLVG